MTNGIGQLAEGSLHAALKEALSRPADEFEVSLDGYVIDIVRGDLLIEIQTRHLYALRPKLRRLLDHHPIQLVHPIPAQKWILRETATGDFISRRKSPKRGRAIDLFKEAVRVPGLLAHPNLALRIMLTQEDEVWRDDGQGSWRRKGWSRADRRLLAVESDEVFESSFAYLRLLPEDLPQPFTSKILAERLGCPGNLAQKMTYTLRKLGLLEMVGKDGRATLFAVAGRDA